MNLYGARHSSAACGPAIFGPGRLSMEIVGIGTEIVECLRIRRMIEEHGEQFLLRIFTEKEIRSCQSRRHATEQFAARWAGKEAVLKSLGTVGGKGASWNEIEIDSDEEGKAKAAFH